jgi:hypothetical protein
MEDVLLFGALFIALPYVLGVPLAILWVAIAYAVRWATGWRLLPRDVAPDWYPNAEMPKR